MDTSGRPFDTYIIRCNFGERVVIIFPALAFGSIAADYSYTRQWKKARLEHNKQQVQHA